MKKKNGVLRKVYHYQKIGLTVYLFMLIITGLITLGSPLAIKYITDEYLMKNKLEEVYEFWWLILIVVLIIALFQGFLNLKRNKLINSSNKMLRHEVLQIKQKAIYESLNKSKVGTVINIVESDIPNCINVIINIFFQLIINLLSFIIVLIILMSINRPLTLLMLTSSILYFFVYISFGRITKIINGKFLDARDGLGNSITNIFSNLNALKRKVKHKTFFNDYTDEVETMYYWYNKKGIVDSIVIIINYSLQSILILSVLYIGGLQVKSGALSIGALIAFLMYSVSFFSPLVTILNLSLSYKGAVLSISRVSDFLNMDSEVKGNSKEKIINGDIILSGDAFDIPDNQVISKGEINILRGGNGVGKSTLINLIYKLKATQDKKIFIDNTDINKIAANEIRKKVAVSFQNPSFPTNNIQLIFETIFNKSETEKYHRDIRNFAKYHYDQYYNTKKSVEELSGGKKQLLSFLMNVSYLPHVLIFDETFSNMDSQTAEECIELLRKIKSFTTILVVSHNENIFRGECKVVNLKGFDLNGFILSNE